MKKAAFLWLWFICACCGAEEAPKPAFTMAPARHDFGKMQGDEAQTFIFTIERADKTPVWLGRLYSPCPCIKVESKSTFTADEPVTVTVKLSSKGLTGKKTFPFYVEILEPEKIVLRGDVDLEVEGGKAEDDWRLTPALFDYGKVFEGEVRTQVFQILRPGNAAVSFGRLYSPCPCLFVTAKQLSFKENEPADIEVKVCSLTLEGPKTFPVYVEMVQPERKVLRADVLIEVIKVPAKLKIFPESLALGQAAPGKTIEVKIINLSKRPLALKSVACSVKGLSVSLPGGSRIEPGVAGSISVKVENPQPGPLQGMVMIETDCPEHARVEIPVEGMATDTATPNEKKE